MARFRKIYIDTRHRNLNESLSTSDFVIDLPETQETGANTKLYLHELSLPNRRKFRSLTSDNIDNSSRAVQSER